MDNWGGLHGRGHDRRLCDDMVVLRESTDVGRVRCTVLVPWISLPLSLYVITYRYVATYEVPRALIFWEDFTRCIFFKRFRRSLIRSLKYQFLLRNSIFNLVVSVSTTARPTYPNALRNRRLPPPCGSSTAPTPRDDDSLASFLTASFLRRCRYRSFRRSSFNRSSSSMPHRCVAAVVAAADTNPSAARPSVARPSTARPPPCRTGASWRRTSG